MSAISKDWSLGGYVCDAISFSHVNYVSLSLSLPFLSQIAIFVAWGRFRRKNFRVGGFRLAASEAYAGDAYSLFWIN